MKRPATSLVQVLTKLHGHSKEVSTSPGTEALGRFAITVIAAREGRDQTAFVAAVDDALAALDRGLEQTTDEQL